MRWIINKYIIKAFYICFCFGAFYSFASEVNSYEDQNPCLGMNYLQLKANPNYSQGLMTQRKPMFHDATELEPFKIDEKGLTLKTHPIVVCGTISSRSYPYYNFIMKPFIKFGVVDSAVDLVLFVSKMQLQNWLKTIKAYGGKSSKFTVLNMDAFWDFDYRYKNYLRIGQRQFPSTQIIHVLGAYLPIFASAEITFEYSLGDDQKHQSTESLTRWISKQEIREIALGEHFYSIE